MTAAGFSLGERVAGWDLEQALTEKLLGTVSLKCSCQAGATSLVLPIAAALAVSSSL